MGQLQLLHPNALVLNPSRAERRPSVYLSPSSPPLLKKTKIVKRSLWSLQKQHESFRIKLEVVCRLVWIWSCLRAYMIIWYFKTDFSIAMENIAQSRRGRKEISCMSSKLEMAFCIWFCPMCCVVSCLCQQVSCCRLDGADSSHRKAAVCQAAEGQQSRRPLLQACSAVGETVPASHCTLHVG